MSFETWLETWFEKFAGGRTCYQSMVEAYDGGHAEAEAQIAALQSERDALRDALKLARARMAHRIGCTTINPTEEWAEKGSVNTVDCHCEISVIDAALSTPASGEPARKS